MFEPNRSWSYASHLYMVSDWSAYCTKFGDPMSCHSDITQHAFSRLNHRAVFGPAPQYPQVHFDYTDLTYLLHRFGVSWGYYIEQGVEADCPNDQVTCAPQPQRVGKGLSTVVPDIWNPLPEFDTVNQDAPDRRHPGHLQVLRGGARRNAARGLLGRAQSGRL